MSVHLPYGKEEAVHIRNCTYYYFVRQNEKTPNCIYFLTLEQKQYTLCIPSGTIKKWVCYKLNFGLIHKLLDLWRPLVKITLELNTYENILRIAEEGCIREMEHTGEAVVEEGIITQIDRI